MILKCISLLSSRLFYLKEISYLFSPLFQRSICHMFYKSNGDLKMKSRAHFHKIKVKANEVSYVVHLNIFIIKMFAYLNNIIIISHSCTNLIMHSAIVPPSELHLSWFSIKIYVQLIILFSSSFFLLSSLACSWNIDWKLIKNSLHEWEISSHSIRLRSLLSNRARYLL